MFTHTLPPLYMFEEIKYFQAQDFIPLKVNNLNNMSLSSGCKQRNTSCEDECDAVWGARSFLNKKQYHILYEATNQLNAVKGFQRSEM